MNAYTEKGYSNDQKKGAGYKALKWAATVTLAACFMNWMKRTRSNRNEPVKETPDATVKDILNDSNRNEDDLKCGDSDAAPVENTLS